MSELPRTEERYDAARVEEAFASFAERVQELESVAGELREELRALRSERLEQERLGRQQPDRQWSSERYEDEAWPVDRDPERVGLDPRSDRIGPDWIASVPAPTTHRVAVPRFALEATFLLLVALLAGLADLSTTAIVIVMATALALVVLSEVANAARRARWRLDAVAGSVGATGEEASESTGPWSMPVVEATAVEAPDDSESHTVVTKLPPELEPDPGLEAPEVELEPAPEPEPEPDPDTQPEAVAEPATADPAPAEHDSGRPDPAEPETAGPAEAETEDAESAPSIPPAKPDPDADPEPKRRFGFLRRKRRADDPAAETPDPWEI
ncbi:MAG: hypothetical protein MSC30_08690 [Gaiellaceae bacterium MAG52_C11]|nr:hypothetical protein [Candidatus Gaiellasilicea maunaloa]